MNEKLTRCGMCGDFQKDPKLYSQKEQDEAELVYCDSCTVDKQNQERQYITRDMAIDAGDLSLEGQLL